jgi:hypothetical protein
MDFGLRRKVFFIMLVLIVSTSYSFAQAPKNLYVAKRIYEAPDIDGFIGEEVWNTAETDTVAKQYTPYNGKKSSKRTEFKILYDDKALYVAAILYDNPDSIIAGLGRRDDAFDMNADQFIIDIGPYNDGINSFSFMVSSSGVQSDYRNYFDTKDMSWDAVWKSKVKINDRGWVVEMKIPHSAIHFSKNIFQVWSLNISRLIKRKEELSTWNFIDRDIAGITNQSGELIGIERIKPPFRLSVSPWLSEYLIKEPELDNWKSKLKGGFELKYGINQSFTLDATLWPDYGQVAYDDVVLNVGPFETLYPEQRQFFNDGADMFSRAGLFYSRRIAFLSEKSKNIDNQLDTNEVVSKNPEMLDILNAFKITGRTSKKLGFGLMNVMSKPGYAIIEDTISGNLREIQSQSFTNYNVVEFDKTLENNSFISFINTNLIKDNYKYISNVTGTEFRFSNRKMSYSFSGMAAISQLYDTINGTELGYRTNLYFDKTSGKFQFRFGNEIISTNYNQNDMGYLPYFNEVSSFSRFNYNIYDPFWYILSTKSLIELRYSTLYNTLNFTDAKLSYGTDVLFKNQYSVNFSGFWRPFGNHDYYEARQPNSPFIKAPSFSTYLKLQSDPRKVFSLSLYHRYWGNSSSIKMTDYTYGIIPYLRIQSRLQLGFDFLINKFTNSIGYVESFNDSIFMGQRDIKTFSNTFMFIFSFTNKSWLNLKVRHYWSNIVYNKFYSLRDNGKLESYDAYPLIADRDFQMLNLDCSFKWEFAPGSQVSVVWKNIFTRKNYLQSTDYFNTFDDMMNSPRYNSLSIKLLYYFDFIYLKKNGNSKPPVDTENLN